MNHQISREDFKDVESQILLASSSADNKRLFAVANLLSNSIKYFVKTTAEETSSFENIDDAIEKYNNA